MRKHWWVYLILCIGLIAMLFPFFWMVLSAFKTTADVYVYPPKWFPSKWDFGNFARVFDMVPFALYYANSILVTLAVTFGQLFISILAAFALSRLHFPFKNFFFILIISTMLMPFVVTMIPVFLIVSSFKWIDTYQGLIIPSLFSGFSIIFLRQFFISIPQDLQDAAMIDGCGFLRILFQVVLPNAKPAIATITLFNFLGEWRNYLWPLIVTNSTKMRTLPVGLRYLMTDGGGEYHLMMAASLMAILPVLIVYVFSEKQFIKSVTFTGLKS
jgi:multiple sugar transport system permease protein